ncbi:MAG: hypothetical protein K0S40_2308 [Actinomycetospora sp.]|jgi:hypothetical protein|nr:hypothetical protein [Actinomycetospora sp.]
MSSTTTTGDGTTAAAPTDIREFGHELWSFLTGKGAVIEYELDDMTVEVPRTTGPDSPRATWKMNGTLRIRTSDDDSRGSLGSPSASA